MIPLGDYASKFTDSTPPPITLAAIEEKAERIVVQELRKIHWQQKDLARNPKGDARKVAIAKRLRQETTMTLKWIAQRLEMGTWTHVTNRLYHLNK